MRANRALYFSWLHVASDTHAETIARELGYMGTKDVGTPGIQESEGERQEDLVTH